MAISTLAGPASENVEHDTPPRLLISGGTRRFATLAEFDCRFSNDADAPFEGVIILDRAAAAELPELLRRRRAWLVPIADLSGAQSWYVDISCADTSPLSIRRAVEELIRVIERLDRLPATVAAATDDETLLLARTYSRGGRLQPVYDGASPSLLRYPAAGLLESPTVTAERLCESGWLDRTFFDRLHVCPRCVSSRLNVREECSACRSPQLAAESFVHHFRCGFQATERHFFQGEALICPKCRRRLRHFGVDYDRPGSARTCRACQHVDGDASIGFVCIDCGAHSDAAQVTVRDWHGYSMTAAGEQRLLGGDLRRLKPDNIRDEARVQSLAEHWLRIQSRYGRPSVVLQVAFTRASVVRAEHGDRYLMAVRQQAIEIVRGELRDTDLMIEAPDALLVVLPETEAHAIDAPRRRLSNRLSSLLAVDLGIDIKMIEPHQLALTNGATAQ